MPPPSSFRTFEQQLPPALPRRDPSGLLRQQPITAHISYTPTRVPVRHFPTSSSATNLSSNNNHYNNTHFTNNNIVVKRSSRTSALLEDTIPQFQALQIAKPINPHKEYENYFYI
jgi:hypothetical protein